MYGVGEMLLATQRLAQMEKILVAASQPPATTTTTTVRVASGAVDAMDLDAPRPPPLNPATPVRPQRPATPRHIPGYDRDSAAAAAIGAGGGGVADLYAGNVPFVARDPTMTMADAEAARSLRNRVLGTVQQQLDDATADCDVLDTEELSAKLLAIRARQTEIVRQAIGRLVTRWQQRQYAELDPMRHELTHIPSTDMLMTTAEFHPPNTATGTENAFFLEAHGHTPPNPGYL